MIDNLEDAWRPLGNSILQSDLSGVTKHVLIATSVLMFTSGEQSFPPVKQIADATHLSARTVSKHIKIAQIAGWDAALIARYQEALK
ncbi:MAG TPA: hypothetical protein VN150_07990 [Ochrobactrum sp.]|nr:hypothetical protein [Ochrobactrum sp.]